MSHKRISKKDIKRINFVFNSATGGYVKARTLAKEMNAKYKDQKFYPRIYWSGSGQDWQVAVKKREK